MGLERFYQLKKMSKCLAIEIPVTISYIHIYATEKFNKGKIDSQVFFPEIFIII